MPPAAFSKETARARLAALREQQAAIRAVADPIRAERDAWWAEAGPKERAYHDAILKAETGLFDVEQEIAFLTRGLGAPPEPAAPAEVEAEG